MDTKNTTQNQLVESYANNNKQQVKILLTTIKNQIIISSLTLLTVHPFALLHKSHMYYGD